jgi:tripartite-type tricarboxylate transporter receptor subunit TctC
VISHIKSGKLRAIVVGGETRVPALPQVPTFAEGGLPDYDRQDSWHGIVAPAGTPKPIVDKLSTEIARILAAPDVQESLANQGLDQFISTPAEVSALIKTDIARIATIIKTANIRFENN